MSATYFQKIESLLLSFNRAEYTTDVQKWDWLKLDEVSPLELAQTVDAGGHVGAELQVSRQYLQLVHGQIREQHDTVLFHSHDQSCLTLVTSWQHLHVVPCAEQLAQLFSLEL